MEYIKEITVDLSGEMLFHYITATQGDTARAVKITIISNNQPYTPENGAWAVLRAKKPDKTSVFNSATINDDGTITAELTEQVTAVVGNVRCEVTLYGADGRTLSTVPFIIKVTPASLNPNIASSNEFTALANALAEVREADGVAEAALQAATEALNTIEEAETNILGYEQIDLLRTVKASTGFLSKEGSVYNTNTGMQCLYTDIIPCKEGEVFIYTGIGRSSTASWVFYKGATLVSYGQTGTNTPATVTVTVPENVDGVKFSSFEYTPNEVVLEVYKVGSTSYLLNEKINKNTEGIDELKNETENLKDEATGIKNEIANLNGVGNVLYGKKYVACGDSFTAGSGLSTFADGVYAGEKKAYPYLIGLRNNMTVINEAIGGSTMTYIEGRENCFSAENGRYTQIPADADYITIKFGINDDGSHQNAPIGTIDDTVNTTFYGAWNIVMEYLITNHPLAKIGIIVTNGMQGQVAYAEAIRNIATKWGIPYLDEDGGEQVPLLHRTNRNVPNVAKQARLEAFRISESDTHPNEAANEYESTFVEAWLRTL